MEKQPLDFSVAFGSAVHDVKNSVGLLLSSLDEFMTANPPQTEEENRRAVVLNYEASRINNDMMHLLSIYRLENQRLFSAIEEGLVNDFIEDELLAHETLLTMKQVEVEVDCDPDLCWYFDSMLLKSVFNNVFVNTIRYTKSKMRIAVELVNGYLRITIEDDGNGFPKELCKEPGEYLTRINFNTGSTGLGLYFSAKVAEMHRNNDRVGYIEVDNDSTMAGGAFRIYLP